MLKIKKSGLTSRDWTDSSISLDERQIKECRGGWQSLLSSSWLIYRKIKRLFAVYFMSCMSIVNIVRSQTLRLMVNVFPSLRPTNVVMPCTSPCTIALHLKQLERCMCWSTTRSTQAVVPDSSDNGDLSDCYSDDELLITDNKLINQEN